MAPTVSSRTFRRLVTTLAAAVLLAAACGDDQTIDSGGAPGDDAVGDWILRSGTVDDEPLTPIPGYDATLSFGADGTFGGTAACNGYGGMVTLGDGTLELGEYSITEMGCEPDVMALESLFVQALTAATTFTATTDELVLSGDGVELVFAPIPAVPEAELVGTDWTLDTLIDGETASSVQGTATLRLDEDGSFEGSTGCRTLTGEWLVAAGSLQFPSLAADGDCQPELADQDGFVISVLEGPATVEIDGATLTLSAPGDIGLRYRSDLD